MAHTTIPAQLYKQGKTYQWLADSMDVTPGTIARWVLGTRPQHFSMMRQCADLLLCEPSDLWPEIRMPIDWEHRYNVITDHLEHVHYKSPEFTDLCRERAAASVHLFVSTRRKTIESYMDTYSVKEIAQLIDY